MLPGLLDLALGFATGLTLGLLGGGGSILMVPVLVYLVGLSPQAAVTASLAIVGANSLFGAWFHMRQGRFNGRVAAVFGGAGMIASYLSAGASRGIPAAVLMTLLALLMLVIAALMLRKPAQPAEASGAGPRPLATPRPSGIWAALAAGLAVGALTGVLGVGGGFLIVPALVLLLGLPMGEAVGTSLAIITANSLAGLLGHLGEPIDLWLIAFFALSGIAGTFAGTRLAQRLPAARLRQGFAVFVLLLAAGLIVDQLPGVLALL
jgi:uncharacterized membrane protein YfcA